MSPWQRLIDCRWSSPCASTTWQPVRTVMLSMASICLIRYVDIDASRLGPRTTSVTVAACLAKNTAAWPAELAPPTM